MSDKTFSVAQNGMVIFLSDMMTTRASSSSDSVWWPWPYTDLWGDYFRDNDDNDDCKDDNNYDNNNNNNNNNNDDDDDNINNNNNNNNNNNRILSDFTCNFWLMFPADFALYLFKIISNISFAISFWAFYTLSPGKKCRRDHIFIRYCRNFR